MKKLLILFLILINSFASGQGLNHNFLLGYNTAIDTNTISRRALMSFDSNSFSINPTLFKMAFRGSQANISDSQGNLLMYTNGCWIADASGDTMQNGSGLNPSALADSWCDASSGMPITNTSVFLPWPGDSTIYILLHQTSTDADPTVSSELFYSIVDMKLNGGLGAVTQKNSIAFQGLLCPSIGACKHANGRDWWIVLMSPTSDTIYKFLLTPAGFQSMSPQSSGLPLPNKFLGSVQFSPDGSKFAYNHNYYVGSVRYHQLRLLNFDRCSGIFNLPRVISDTSSIGSSCIAFSPNSKYVYYGTYGILYQVNTDTTDILASRDTIAQFDSYCYPYFFTCANYWYGYLAANGKIYISPSNGIDFTYINEPDSEGISCDTKLHALRLPCYIARTNVFHPNYYLGPVIGSACDSLAHVGMYELEAIKNFKLFPNPSRDGIFSISYILPQNESGVLKVFDLMGKEIYKMQLPQWSTMQTLNLPFLNDGVYNLSIHSGESSLSKRLVILR